MLENKKINFTKLVNYGFIKNGEHYLYQTNIVDDQFDMQINVDSNGKFSTKVMDVTTKEEYVLHLAESINGVFVGQVRSEYQEILQDIINKCTDINIFKAKQTLEVIELVEEMYGDKLEFLWPKFPNNAIFRNGQTKKWYAAILSVKAEVIGKSGEELVEVIDLHFSADRINELVDNKIFLPGYHMNKKYWLTICLDDTIPTSTIKDLIKESYANS